MIISRTDYDVVAIISIRNLDRGIVLDRLNEVIIHSIGLVVLNGGIHVILTMNGDGFLILGVIHGNFIVTAAARRRIGLHAADHARSGQLERRHLVGVVNPSGDDGLVRVALQEIHDHLLADARDLHRPPTLAGRWMGDAHPAGTVFIEFAVAVPVELDFNAAEFVGVDLLACGAHHDGGLGALDHRLGGGAWLAIGLFAVQGGEAAGVDILHLRRQPGGVGVRLQFVGGGHDKVFPVLVLARKFDQLEQAAHGEAAGVGLSLNLLVFRLKFFDARPNVSFAVAGLRVFAGVVKDFHLGAHMASRNGRFHQQVGLGALEIVVIEGINAGLDLLRHGPLVDVVLFTAQVLVRREKGYFFVAGKRFVGTDRIGQHERVFVFFVFEIVVDALLLHEPAGEVEIGFAVLDAVGPLAISAAERFFEIREAEVPKHLLDDIRNGHILKDPAVGRPGQEPQPGMHSGCVEAEIAQGARQAEPAHEPVEITGFVLGQLEANGDILPQKILELDVRIFAEQVEVKLKQAAQRLRGGHAVKQEDIVAQRCENLDRSFCLEFSHGLPSNSR